jgi:peptide/nickel transport system substrate-binding protein
MVSKAIALSIAAIIVVAAAVAGVYILSTPPAEQEEKVVTIAFSAAPPSLDAVSWTGAEIQSPNWLLYDRLVEVNQTMDVVPGLASSWSFSPDGLTWTFILRSGIKFHDGTDFNADAVK